MRTVWTSRAVQVTAKYGEHAPAAAVCCNACRACATTNVVGLAIAGAGAVAAAVTARLGRSR